MTDHFHQSTLLQYSLVVFVIGTTGQGDVPRNATLLWKKLLRRKLAHGCLAAVKFTTFGLGDSSYPKYVEVSSNVVLFSLSLSLSLNLFIYSHYPVLPLTFIRFNWAARKLVRRLEQLGALEVFPSGEADERHAEGCV